MLKKISLLPLFIAFAFTSFAQKEKTETIPVSGNCGMCKSTIEKAAKEAGAASADWSVDTKILTVKYNSSSTNAAKIQQSIAKAGYDTRDFKAPDEAYKKLHTCCQYDRQASAKAKHQCDEKCKMKDGKCTDMQACKDKGCCKDEASTDNMECCKGGKCEKHS